VLLADLGPLRMDEVTHDGDPLASVVTEAPDDIVHDLKETVADMGSRLPSDDYGPEREPETDHRRAET
jgi:hypothetical protein